VRPLYLRGADARVELDGPALKVRHPERADVWFPLQRVSRVVSDSRVGWAMPALMACAGGGITVTFLADDGAVLARLVGQPGERAEIRQRLRDALLRPDWPARYADWLAGMQRMALRSVARRIGMGVGQPPTPRALHQALQAAARDRDLLPAYTAAGRALHALVHSQTLQALQDAGIAPDDHDWPGFDLTHDLTDLLFWDLHLARLAWLGARRRCGQPDPPDSAAVVAFFEQRRARLDHLLTSLIGRLHRWLIEL